MLRGTPNRPCGSSPLKVPLLVLVAATIAWAAAALPSHHSAAAGQIILSDTVRVTNVTDTTFVVSWVTSEPSEGHVEYGTESGQLSQRADDERGASYAGYTHFVRVSGLVGAGTRHYYAVVSGDSRLESASNYLLTGPSAQADGNRQVNGYVQTYDGDEAPHALAYVYPQKASNTNIPSAMVWLAALTESDGSFSVDLGEARAATNVARTVGGAFGQLDVGDRIRYRAVGGLRSNGYDPNDTGWQTYTLTEDDISGGAIDLDPFALPYAEYLTPSATATPTPTSTPTPPAPSPTPTLIRTSTATPTALLATATITPAAAITTQPTAAPIARATATPPPVTSTASSRKPTVTPPRATPRRATPTSAPASGAMRPGASSPTARPTVVADSPTPNPFTAGDENVPMPDGLRALLAVGALLLTGGLAIAAVGVYQGLRRRAA